MATMDTDEQRECFFCASLRHPNEHTLVHKSDGFGVLMDLYPINKGHLLVFPTAHIPDIFIADARLYSAMLAFSQRLACAMRRIYCVEKVAMFTSGKATSDHAHIHVLPLRYGLKKTFENLSSMSRAPARQQELRQEGVSIIEEALRL